jgi:transcriptional regulator with XRE-family HTH domain
VPVTQEDLQKLIGRNIRIIRERKNMSAQELAGICNFEKSNMSRLESGNTNPTIWTLYKICQALGVTLEEIVSERDA